ncbi:MAG: DUF4294 domain-containing protein [Flavobacteriales bacterium]|nr:DUF4294 domain-containing protein [Flavobacteriales bacterium]
MVKYLVIFVLGLSCLGLQSQIENTESANPFDYSSGFVVPAHIENGDTIPTVGLKPYYIFDYRTFASKSEQRKYTRLQYNVKVVYPYAKLAGQLLNKYEHEMDTITDKKIRKQYYKKVEEELLAKYSDELKEMTISQGRILIKLVDRETNRTSYELVHDLRSGFTAFFWQGLARLFGHDLKSEYLAEQEDKYIEEIVLAIEHGQY